MLHSSSGKLADSPKVVVRGVKPPEYDVVLTPEALIFLGMLSREFESTRRKLLEYRGDRHRALAQGRAPDFLQETTWIREQNWKAAGIPPALRDRRVEITGPPERKMVINALNSGARVFMADFEDSSSPTWANMIEGQINLMDAVQGGIEYTSPEGKHYTLAENTATLMVRPRGWHLIENHVLVDGEPISASLFDFGLFFFHNAKEQMVRGVGPYFYLPKLESHLEARLWNQVFNKAQRTLNIPQGTVRATVLIEHVLAAFEMDEILYELRRHSAGLNCGRWDYIFSVIKTFARDPAFVLPDRGQVTMDKPFMQAYVDLLIRTCHRRGVHAMGGMAAQIPIKNDAHANQAALDTVQGDKLREVLAGHDGTWVAHPGLVPLAAEVFDRHMPEPNQIHAPPAKRTVTPRDLLQVPEGTRTVEGLHHNINVGLLYLANWLEGRGCVPLYHLMEDAATAEICRSQVWQWIHHGAELEDGTVVTAELVTAAADEEMNRIADMVGLKTFSEGAYGAARDLFMNLVTPDTIPEFLTVAAYKQLT